MMKTIRKKGEYMESQKEINRRSMGKEIIENVKLFLSVLIITTLINTLFMTFSTVKQSSMEHTLYENEVIIIEKLKFLFTNPEFGDIIIFVEDEPVSANYIKKLTVMYNDIIQKFAKKKQRMRLVKRVIGLPGDQIDIKNGYVYRNGEKIEEPYIEDLTFEGYGITYPLTVPEGKYFVLGDNRDVSKDSRAFGLIPRDNIEGRAVFRLYPLSRIGNLTKK